MANLLVGYDLNKTKDYPRLHAKLKSYPNWWHWLDSTWIIVAQLTAIGLRDELRPFIDADDELFVVDISGDAAAWAGFNGQASTWLKTNL